MENDPREARLRPEYSALYPTITPGVWQPAARVAERLLLYLLRHPALLDRLPERLLNGHHFEFRGGSDEEGHASRRLQVGRRPEEMQDEQQPPF
jgi:hypothetical protein